MLAEWTSGILPPQHWRGGQRGDSARKIKNEMRNFIRRSWVLSQRWNFVALLLVVELKIVDKATLFTTTLVSSYGSTFCFVSKIIDHARLQSPMLDLGRLWLTLDGSCRPRSTIVEHGRPCSTTRRPWAMDDHVSFMIGYGRPLTNLFDDDRPWSTMAEHGHL